MSNDTTQAERYLAEATATLDRWTAARESRTREQFEVYLAIEVSRLSLSQARVLVAALAAAKFLPPERDEAPPT